jgi:hypothetical protein
MTSGEKNQKMKLRLAVLALLLTTGTASAANESRWTSVGWYVLAYGLVSDEEEGWLELTGGLYSVETACKAEADRQNLNKADYMILHSCKHLQKPPRPARGGGIEIWVPAN